MGEAKREVEAKPEEKKEEKAEEKKEEAKPGPPPPVVLSVDLHCVGCAKKIEKCILKCKGVENVETDMMQNQVTVNGIVDPQVLCSRIQKRTMRKVKILSPLPPAEGEPKPEPPPPEVIGITTIELLVNMHCEACAEHLKRKILKMRGVQTAETHMSSGKVAVTGTMSGEMLVEYIHRRTGKIASIVPPPSKEEEEGKKDEAEKKPEEKPAEEKQEEKKEPAKEENADSKKEEQAPEPKDAKEEKGGGGEEKKGEGEATAAVVSQEDMMKKMMYWHGGFIGEEEMLPRRIGTWMPMYVIHQPPPPPPQLFSDENPNACCIA